MYTYIPTFCQKLAPQKYLSYFLAAILNMILKLEHPQSLEHKVCVHRNEGKGSIFGLEAL
jgi:hypothetical protein